MKPILFNTDMVRAILEGRKTVTRRILKNAEMYINCECNAKCLRDAENGVLYCEHCGYPLMATGGKFLTPHYQPGDVLWVRETWCWCPCWDCGMLSEDETTCQEDNVERVYSEAKDEWGCYCHKASCLENEQPSVDVWHPSIHMPRNAARIFLRVKGVRVERLRNITPEDISCEGIQSEYYIPAFHDLWDSTIKPADRALYGWEANPWVWVIEFERIGREEARHDD